MPKPDRPTAIAPLTTKALEMTALAPSDTNSTTNKITRTMPLIRAVLADTDGNLYAQRPVANDCPDCLAMIDQADPDCPVSIRIIGNAVAGSPSAANFTEKIAYSNSIPAVALPDYLQVCADGAGAWLLVKHSDVAGVGRVLMAADGIAKVEF